LPKKVRLLKRAQFLTLSKKGIKVHTDCFIAIVLKGTAKTIELALQYQKK
jgi:ribonuclease P protein component